MVRFACLAFVASGGVFGFDGTARAQATPAGGAAETAPGQPSKPEAHANILEEVVVTSARKRSENVQTTPIAVTALNQSTLERDHVTDISDIGSLAPNLHIQRTLGTAGASVIYLRGFGQNSNDPAVDPKVALFIDGVYNPAPSGTELDMFDIDEVEVEAGPQGTLLGKNAPVGAIYMTTAKPTGEFGGMLEGDYGSYDHFGVRGRVNVPIIQDDQGNSILAGKLSFVYKEGGNWVLNLANNKRDIGGENAKAGRLALRFTPDENFQWDLVGSLDKEDDPQGAARDVGFLGGFPGTSSNASQIAPAACLLYPGGVCPLTSYGTTNNTYTKRPTSDQVQVSSTMSYRFDPVTVTSITGFLNYWMIDNQDLAGTPFTALAPFNDRTRYDEETQEIRISSNKGGGWNLNDTLDWVVGGYFSNYDYSFSNHLGVLNGLFGFPNWVPYIHQNQNGITQSYAAFAHVIYNLNDKWTATFGVRRSWDKKWHSFQAAGPGLFSVGGPFAYDTPAGFNNTSFEAGTAYQFDADRMAYFRFAQGYESGGFAGFAVGNEFQPELNNAYELGFKSDWLQKQLRINADIFLNELSQLQLFSSVPIPVSPFFQQRTLNAGAATIEGMEAQITAVPNDNLTTYLNVGYLHTRYDHYTGTVCSIGLAPADCSGLPFAYAPKWTIDLGGDYVQDLPNDLGTATLSLDVNYRSGQYLDDPPYPSSHQSGYALVNAGLKFQDPSEKYSIEFYGTNILDRHYRSQLTDPGGIAMWQQDGRPAEWGMRVIGKF